VVRDRTGCSARLWVKPCMGDEELENASLLWVKPYTKTFLWFLARCAYAVDIVPVIFVSFFFEEKRKQS
jgi:hypothetical protein